MSDASHALEKTIIESLGRFDTDNTFLGHQVYSAMTNTLWTHPDHDNVSHSFRAAAAFVAELYDKGSYMDWYCDSKEGEVSDFMSNFLGGYGWSHKPFVPNDI